jgi:Na+-transporting methylmalonyl-CoA/oxaloacetate decarboxylase gamma subunit
MKEFEFGMTLLLVGMGGTLVTLYALTWVIRGITALFPPEKAPHHGRD